MVTRTDKTPTKLDLEKLAMAGDRFALMPVVTPKVPLGTLQICDVRQIGPANPKFFKLDATEWDKGMAQPTNGRCKGLFCASFNRKQLTRRCSAATDASVCDLCARIRSTAVEGEHIVLKGIPEYEIVKCAVFQREGVKAVLKKWPVAGDVREGKKKPK